MSTAVNLVQDLMRIGWKNVIDESDHMAHNGKIMLGQSSDTKKRVSHMRIDFED